MLKPASTECNGKALRGPNDLTLDTPNGGFYFSDPGGSDLENLIGTVHYVDHHGKTHLIDQGLAFPNGIVLTPDGTTLYLAESQKNRVLVYEVNGAGQVRNRKLFANLPKHPSGDLLRNQPDGMCLDQAGNLYIAHYGMQQVQVLNPEGELTEAQKKRLAEIDATFAECYAEIRKYDEFKSSSHGWVWFYRQVHKREVDLSWRDASRRIPWFLLRCPTSLRGRG